jgi:acyl carrier protein
MSTAERVKKVLVNDIGIKEAEIVPTATLREQLGVDSTEMVEIIVGLEKEFSIQISDSKVEKLKTVQDLINLVGEK